MQKYSRNTKRFFWAVPRPYCNCGSFALDIPVWFLPYEDGQESDRRLAILNGWFAGDSRKEIMERLLAADEKAILAACPWVERITLNEARPQDRVVAYRIGIDGLEDGNVDEDFHFRVRINGQWFEKCGEENVRPCPTKSPNWAWRNGNFYYDSRIIYFRFRNLKTN